MRQIVLDTETTGLQIEAGHRIIEIGCIELINRKITGKRYHQYINPQREIEQGALSVHGITLDFLQGSPVFADIANPFIEFITGAELIIHNAPFDLGFINYELKLTQKKWKSVAHYCAVIDTLVIARQLHMGQRNSLDALCKRYRIDNSNRELHGALLDAHLLAQVYLAMTGGQGSLFDEQRVNDAAQEKYIIKKPNIRERNLRVIAASPEEINAHENQLQKMAEKGACMWREKNN